MAWSTDALPELAPRTIVITGANSGIGWEAARMLAERGARVVMACRSPERAKVAADAILARLPTARLELVQLDLGSLTSIRSAAEEIRSRFPAVDALVNNAGVMAIPRTLTADGFEMQLGTNHLGHFALTGLLMDALSSAPAGRVVNVTSYVHWGGRIAFDDLAGERSYQKWVAYMQSKLANLLFTYELQRRLAARSSGVLSVACHPGYASTNLQGVGPKMEGSALGAWFMSIGNMTLAQSAAGGALPTVYAAAMDNVASGDVYGPGVLEMWGAPKKVGTSAASRDPETAARLWAESERLTGVRWLS